MIAVVGAGIQGCALALELASRGLSVELFDRAEAPMQCASRWNEGKIHLGYIFAKDRSLASARQMIRGAMEFAGFFERHLGERVPQERCSDPFRYAVHNNSMLSVQQVEAHLHAVDSLLESAPGEYLGERILRKVRPAKNFNPEHLQAVFETPERSLDVQYLADRIASAVLADPLIAFHGGATVAALSRTDTGAFKLRLTSGEVLGDFAQLVNCAWESRLLLDSTLGYKEKRSWMHRYKLALHLADTPCGAPIASTTFVLAPLGDVVNFGGGKFYLSWYPSCKIAESFELAPPEPSPSPEQLKAVGRDSLRSLSLLMPALSELKVDWSKAHVKGGHIFAWGEADIDREWSGLHRRFDIGVFSDEGFHSIDTGKLGMAAVFAREAADRICALAAASLRGRIRQGRGSMHKCIA